MEFKWISAFVTLAQYLNFNKAAASMYITQPALSKYIAALEAEMGVKLFDRSKRSVSLTDAGAALLPLAVNILTLADEAVDAVRNPSVPILHGPLRIGIDRHLDYRDCLSCGLPAAFELFQKRHSLARIETFYLPLQEISVRLRVNMLDIGISVLYGNKLNQLQSGGFDCHLLMQDKMSLVVPRSVRDAYDAGTPISDALSDLRLLTLDADTEFVVERLSSLASVGITSPNLTCATWNEILFRANLGEGFYLLSNQTAQTYAGHMSVIPLEDLGHDERVYFVAFWIASPSPLVRHFLKLLPPNN